ncbi:hypothetical protein [Stetteria hydrogenophila]
MPERARRRLWFRDVADLYLAREAVGGAVSTVSTLLGEALSRTLGAVTGALGARVEAEERVDGPVVLVVKADSSTVRIREGPQGRVRVTGYRWPRGRVELHVEEAAERRTARLTVEAASVTVEAPLKAVGVLADASAVKIEAGKPLDYLSVKADSSGVKASIALARGGGVYAKLDSSALKVQATPEGKGEYWLDADVDSSSLRVEVQGEDKTYNIEEERLHSTRLIAEKTGGEAGVKVKARIKASTSIIRLL